MKMVGYTYRPAEGAPPGRFPHNAAGGDAAGLEYHSINDLKPFDVRIRGIFHLEMRIPEPR
jgi:hypothetical protein